jgi:Asp-tRNA(Asn)/Glu-tRNA(Gln) amidotransferase A subunit family amidase
MPYTPAHKLLTFFDAVPRFRDGSDNPRAYLERCLATIAAREPMVKAWVTTNSAGARQAADESAQRHKAGRPLSAIDGMPVGIKDLFMTRDMPTEMGSPIFKGRMTGEDTPAVQAFRASGAVVLGKTVTTELGFSHPGPTTNPFDPVRTPGGSSSGSAAAIGANMVPVCLGSQVVGSVIQPASFCGNIAIKPTLGALNRGERVFLSQSHLGIHAGSLEDLWAACWAIAAVSGGDPGYPGLYGAPALAPPHQPQRLIVMETEGWKDVDGKTMGAFKRLIQQLKEAGVAILTRRDSKLIEAFEQSIAQSLIVCRDICGFELRWTLRNLNQRAPGQLSASMQGRAQLAKTMTIDDYRAALGRREEMRRRLAQVQPLADAMISLSSVGPAPLLDDPTAKGEPGITHTTGLPAFNAATSALGTPAINLPLMAVAGLPVGIQFVGWPHDDHRLCGLARWALGTLRPVTV